MHSQDYYLSSFLISYFSTMWASCYGPYHPLPYQDHLVTKVESCELLLLVSQGFPWIFTLWQLVPLNQNLHDPLLILTYCQSFWRPHLKLLTLLCTSTFLETKEKKMNQTSIIKINFFSFFHLTSPYAPINNRAWYSCLGKF